jgi:peptide/nickel transport system substrate-binding protein
MAGAEMVTNAAGMQVEKPQYGGSFVGAWTTDVNRCCDEAFPSWSGMYAIENTNEELLSGDWTKGSQGSGEAQFLIRGTLFLELSTGELATDWTFVDDSTATFTLRKGVRFHNKAPTFGRELTAEDVAYNITRMFSDEILNPNPSRTYSSFNDLYDSVAILDDEVIQIKSTPGNIGSLFQSVSQKLRHYPQDAVEANGDMRDWQDSIGTGPFLLDNYVAASVFSYSRNPDYWGTDPLNPENQLPYVDTLKWLIIPDRSTMVAALRTGKIDWIENIGWEERDSLKKTSLDMQEGEYFQGGRPIGMYVMNASVPPFDDIRVRQAMALAVDQVAIKDDFYGGNAVLFSSPAAPYSEFLPWFIPLDEYPQVVRELYEYHPDKAEALLDEAGLPRGSGGTRFKASILTHSLGVEILSIAISYWDAIGVEVELDVRERGVWSSMRGDRSWTSMLDSNFSTVAPYLIPQFRPGRSYSQIEDQRVNDTYATCAANLVTNDSVCQQALRDLYPYMLEQSWYVETPAAKLWVTWQPWIKGYGGETTIGTDETYNFPKYIWNDQALRAK